MTGEGQFPFDALQQFKKDGILTDVCINGSIKAHKVILGMRSPYFLQRFKSSADQNNNNEIEVPEIAHPTLDLLIDFIYSEPGSSAKVMTVCTEGSCDEIISLIDGAKLLLLKDLMQICDEAFQSVKVGMENCLELLHYAELLNSSKLNQITLGFITESGPENINELIGRPGFLHADRKSVRALLYKLSASGIFGQLLPMIINWWKHDGQGRKEDAAEFLKIVPWSQVTDKIMSECLFKNTDDQFKALSFEPVIRQLWTMSPSILPTEAKNDHPSRKLNKSAFLKSLKLRPTLTSSSSASSKLSNPLKRKSSERLSIPYAKRVKKAKLAINSKQQRQDQSLPPAVSSVHQVSSTTTIRTKSHCIFYFIDKDSSSSKLNNTSTYCIRSFDLETGESKFLAACTKQDYSALVYHKNAIYISVGKKEAGRNGKKPIIEGETIILDLNDDDGHANWRDTRSIPTMQIPIHDFQAAVLDNTIYGIGGAINKQSAKGFSVVNTILQFLPNALAQGWTQFQGENGVRVHPKCGASIAVVADKIYSIGGLVAEAVNLPAVLSDMVECFYPAGNSSVVKANLPDTVVGVATAVLGSKIYALGGGTHYQSTSRRTLAYVYDTQNDTWSPIQPMIKRRAFGSAIGYNGYVFAIGGDAHFSIERYDPTKNQWTIWNHSLPTGGNFRSVAFNVHEA